MANRDQGLAAVRNGLQQAAAQSNASPMAQARSNGMLAQVEMQMANDLLPRIDDGEVRMSQLITQIRQLGESISTANALIAGYRKYDPEDVKHAAATQQAAAAGDANNAEWIKNAAGNGAKGLPTLSAVNQEISRLEGELTKAQDELKDLTSKRADFLKEADAVEQQSRDKAPKEGLELYKRAAELRKKATDVRIAMDKIQNRIVPLQGDLAVANAQKQVLTEAVAQFEEQSQQAAKSAAEIAQRSQEQQKVSQSVAEGPGQTITTKAAELAELDKKVKADRDAAIELFTSAIGHFGQAYNGATQLELTLGSRQNDLPSDSPEATAVKGLKTLYGPQVYRVDKAIASQALAMLLARETAVYKHWDDVAKVVKAAVDQAGLKAPPALTDGEAQRQYAKAKTDADQAFHDAHEACQDIVAASNVSDTDRASAKRSDIFTLYSWSQFQRENGEKSAADTNLTAAKEGVKSAKDDNLSLPALPAGLAPPVAVVPAATAPAVASAASTAAPEADATVVGEVKQMLSDVIDAAMKGDGDAIKAHLNVNPVQQPSIDTLIAVITSSVKLNNALKAKFGEEAVSKMPGGGGMPKPEDIKKALAMVQITSTAPDSAAIAGPAGAPGAPPGAAAPKLPLKKMDGVWKFDLSQLPPQQQSMIGMIGMMFKQLPDTLNQLTTDVTAGKYATIEEAQAAIKQALPQMGMMGAPQGGAAPNVAGQPQPPAGAPQ